MALADKELPEGAVVYKRTTEFASGNFPKGLSQDHATKSGVWGLLQVTYGTVVFKDKATKEIRVVASGESQVIEPETTHLAEPSFDARCHIEFFRASDQPSNSTKDSKGSI